MTEGRALVHAMNTRVRLASETDVTAQTSVLSTDILSAHLS